GAVGCAVAYALSRAGYADIQVVERGELAGATSGQAAGLVGQVRASRERCRLAMASVATYSRIEQETGHTADWRQTGSVRIAMTGERAAEFRELAAVARSAGLEVEFLGPARLAELCPVLDGARAEAALWCPTDGYLQPNSLVMAYAGAARERGVTFATRTTVTGIRIGGGAVTGVLTDRGAAATSMLINAAGPWAAPVAALAGLEIPAVPVRHEYFVTRPVTGWHGGLPVPGIRGPVMAAACNAHGVSGSAGLAEHVLESLQPDPSPYVRSLSPARFVPRAWDWESARERAERRYEDYYSLPGATKPARGES